MSQGMITFNICFMKREEQILLLNREKPSWMGCWNGIGGKVEPEEGPRESMIREISEETSILSYDLQFRGLVTWCVDGVSYGGMYLYVAEVPKDTDYTTPIRTEEGILDWKSVDWIMHPQNLGIASNIPHFLKYALQDSNSYDHHCIFQSGQLVGINSTPIEESMEDIESSYRTAYLTKYVG